MQLVADSGEVLIGAQSGVDLPVIPGVVAVGIGLKDRGKIDGVCAELFYVRDPLKCGVPPPRRSQKGRRRNRADRSDKIRFHKPT